MLSDYGRLTPSDSQVWIDFDGTISQRDVLDELIRQFAKNDSWRLIEERWAAGLIGSFECLRSEFALLRISAPELTEFVRRIPIDPGFGALLQLLRTEQVPVAVLSDGIDRLIRLILMENGIGNVPIYANRILHRGSRLSLRCPLRSSQCATAAAHCKCATAAKIGLPDRKNIYIGDGRSDLCPAGKADVVFAKGVLAQELSRRQTKFIPYSTLADVAASLDRMWRSSAAEVVAPVSRASRRVAVR